VVGYTPKYTYHVPKPADADQSGEIDYEEMWRVMSSLGLGLSDSDIMSLQVRADTDKTGTISWSEFAAVAVDLLKDVFSEKDFTAQGSSPWVNLLDPETGARYFYNRSTGDSEWVSDNCRYLSST